jgi:hypothetical protein
VLQVNTSQTQLRLTGRSQEYFRRTKDKFLVYGGEEELVVNSYTDASFQTDKNNFRLQFDFVFCLNGGAVS